MSDLLSIMNAATLTPASIAVRMVLTLVCSGILGLERTRKRRPAGLRTYMLTSLGSCIVMMTGIFLYNTLGSGTDPARMAAQVISGIGFICAGTIMVTRYYRVRGLTTAAGLWVAASLGIAIGAGFLFCAAIAFVLIYITMVFADRFEQYFASHLRLIHVYVMLERVECISAFAKAVSAMDIRLSDVEPCNQMSEQGAAGIYGTMLLPAGSVQNEVLEQLSGIPGVLYMEIISS